MYNGAVKNNSITWYRIPSLEDEWCEAIVDLNRPDSIQQIYDASNAILQRNPSHPNYQRDKDRLDKSIQEITDFL